MRGGGCPGRQSGSGLRGDADDEGVTLTAATAQGRGADPTATPLELQGEVQGGCGHRTCRGVAEGDGPTVGVDLLLGDAELLGGDEADRGEYLVDLDEVEVGGRDALLGAGRLDRLGGLALRVESGPATTPWAPISASQVRPISSALDLRMTTTAAAPSRSGRPTRR